MGREEGGRERRDGGAEEERREGRKLELRNGLERSKRRAAGPLSLAPESLLLRECSLCQLPRWVSALQLSLGPGGLSGTRLPQGITVTRKTFSPSDGTVHLSPGIELLTFSRHRPPRAKPGSGGGSFPLLPLRSFPPQRQRGSARAPAPGSPNTGTHTPRVYSSPRPRPPLPSPPPIQPPRPATPKIPAAAVAMVTAPLPPHPHPVLLNKLQPGELELLEEAECAEPAHFPLLSLRDN